MNMQTEAKIGKNVLLVSQRSASSMSELSLYSTEMLYAGGINDSRK